MISNSIYLLRTNIYLSSSSFTGANPGNQILSTAGGIHFELVENAIISDTSFSSLYGTNGGAIHIASSQSFKQIYNQTFSFTNIQISNCWSSNNGGAIYINDG